MEMIIRSEKNNFWEQYLFCQTELKAFHLLLWSINNTFWVKITIFHIKHCKIHFFRKKGGFFVTLT